MNPALSCASPAGTLRVPCNVSCQGTSAGVLPALTAGSSPEPCGVSCDSCVSWRTLRGAR